MKITNIDVMALEKDLGCGGSRPIIVKIFTDEGIYGIGEAGVAIGTGSRGAFEVLKDFAPMIKGMDPLAHEVIWEKLFKIGIISDSNICFTDFGLTVCVSDKSNCIPIIICIWCGTICIQINSIYSIS